MNFKNLLIGIALVLMLCISPVSALSADDFEIEHYFDSFYELRSYKYNNTADSFEEYTRVYTPGTRWMTSIVTFKPANIPDAPEMVVDTDGRRNIYLPRSVDEWEIKYYSTRDYKIKEPNPKYLKNYGVLNLNKFFGKYVSKGLHLELSTGQYFRCPYAWSRLGTLTIPSV